MHANVRIPGRTSGSNSCVATCCDWDMVPPGSAAEIYGAPLVSPPPIYTCACHPHMAHLPTSYDAGVGRFLWKREGERTREREGETEETSATFKPTVSETVSSREKRRPRRNRALVASLRNVCARPFDTSALPSCENYFSVTRKKRPARGSFEHFRLDLCFVRISTEACAGERRATYLAQRELGSHGRIAL